MYIFTTTMGERARSCAHSCRTTLWYASRHVSTRSKKLLHLMSSFPHHALRPLVASIFDTLPCRSHTLVVAAMIPPFWELGAWTTLDMSSLVSC